MTEQLPFPGLAEGRRLRDAGLEKMERHEWVEEARRVAAQIAREKGRVTSDDIHEVCPPPAHVHHNVWGAVLRPPMFHKSAQVQSRRPSAHARWIWVWRLSAGY